ncbi:MAG: sugar kinase [Acidobacteria bacterium]|nr:sugar kinase [Acidobacteriota bacterium]MCA1637304.1 sugar kinase [Acidobacteriota bacterium]
MNDLNVKSKADCHWDLVSLGEVLLRFDAGDERIHNARTFRVWDGGGEYNVARNLAKGFRQRTAIVTALADNALGRLAEDFIWQAGVDSSRILWREADGIGQNTRNGIYFIERGYGVRGAASCFDRANTAVSQLHAGEIDWNQIFAEQKTRWLHTGGIFAGLSETTPEVAKEAMETARRNNVIVSFDLNYRDSLWKARGGREAANALNRQLLKNADVVFGTLDFDSKLSKFDETAFLTAAEKMQSEFPNMKIIASTLREVVTASLHHVSAVCYTKGEIFKAREFANLNILDRVGSGDAFAAGFIYGLLTEKAANYAVECGTAHAALAMTTPGDNSMATLCEVESLMQGDSAIVRR